MHLRTAIVQEARSPPGALEAQDRRGLLAGLGRSELARDARSEKPQPDGVSPEGNVCFPSALSASSAVLWDGHRRLKRRMNRSTDYLTTDHGTPSAAPFVRISVIGGQPPNSEPTALAEKR